MMINSKQPLKLRHEIKHIINSGDALVLSCRLSKLFENDSHSGSQGFYLVSSLYFDSFSDKALREKIDGVNRREKFRLRFYEQNTEFIKLEKKFKINGLCGKHSASITKEQAEKIISGRDTDFLFHSGNRLLTEFYSKMKGGLLRPKAAVIYKRQAFLYPAADVRITIDSNIRTLINPMDFLSPRAVSIPAEQYSVLEVKYNEFLPDTVKNAVGAAGRGASAFSKYAASRRYN